MIGLMHTPNYINPETSLEDGARNFWRVKAVNIVFLLN